MPEIFRFYGFSFFFYSREHEPLHIHVEGNGGMAKLYTYAQGDPIPAQVEALDIPILYCNEWTETTPLARAEWIRLKILVLLFVLITALYSACKGTKKNAHKQITMRFFLKIIDFIYFSCQSPFFVVSLHRL